MKVGKILKNIPMSNLYIVDIGWGQLRYFTSAKSYQDEEIILYKEQSHHFLFEDGQADKLYDISENRFRHIDSGDKEFDSNEIIVICSFDDCDFHGNIRYDVNRVKFENSNIVIARRDTFVYWEKQGMGVHAHCGQMQAFDNVSNALLFLKYAERRFPYPKEKDWLNAYTFAKKKVGELDIPKMIEKLKVEVHNTSWTRRGSGNVLFSHSSFLYPYEYNYSYLGDKYLDAIFPRYSEDLYSKKDDEYEYINPKYEKGEVIPMANGANQYKSAKYDGLELEEFCALKTKEMRQIALQNYKTYNIDEHINYIAYNHINWWNINEEEKLFQKIKGLANVVWGFSHQYFLEKITIDNYKDLIERNNAKYLIPELLNDWN